MKAAGGNVAQVLKDLLRNRADPERYGRACAELKRLGPRLHSPANVAFLIQNLRHANHHVALDAARALAAIGASDSRPVMDAVLQLLADADAERRSFSTHLLWHFAEGLHSSRKIFSWLVARLNNPNPGCRKDAVEAIGILACFAQMERISNRTNWTLTEALQDRLSGLLSDSDADVVYATVGAVAGMGPAATASAPIHSALLLLLRHPNPHIVNAAASAVNDWLLVADVLIPQLESPDPEIRADTVSRLGRFGERAVVSETLLRRLTVLLEDSVDDVVLATARALRQMGRNVTSRDVVRNALRALLEQQKFWRDAAEAIDDWETVADALVPRLNDPDPRVRREATLALGTFAEPPKTRTCVLDQLARMLTDPESSVVLAATHAMRRAGAIPVVQSSAAAGFQRPLPPEHGS